MPPGFKRDELKARYNVEAMYEDDWHAFCGAQTMKFLSHLNLSRASSDWLLNAGSGVYETHMETWREIPLDLFVAPIRGRRRALCSSVEQLPFQPGVFGGIICVGEVLAYCDPARTIREFARVLAPSGILICDFGNSRSIRYWFRAMYGRAADLVTDSYNGTPERTWIYNPAYICSLLTSSGFNIKLKLGTHTWSALARRIGISIPFALCLERQLEWLQLPTGWADLTTIVAARSAFGK